MTEVEKVIRDLRYVKSFGRVTNNLQLTEIADSAITLLKEQDAVEPYQHDAVWLCGNCGKEVVGWDDYIDGKEYRYPFCRLCGRPVKWDA